MKICVFCGSRNGLLDVYQQSATRLGHELAKNDHSLVYGGGDVGLMGA